MLASLLLCAALVAAVPQPGQNLLADPGFELGTGWAPYTTPLVYDTAIAHGGRRSLRLDVPGPGTTGAAGAKQALTFDPPLPPGRWRVGGWAKSQDAVVAQDFNLYLDLHYADGTPLWGQIASFAPGSHDWQYSQTEFETTKPLSSIEVFAFLRLGSGTVWFDDLYVGLAALDWRSLEPRAGTYGPRSLSVVAEAGRPAKWSLRLVSAGRTLAEASGTNGTAQLDWLGTPADGASAELEARLTDPATGETSFERRSVSWPVRGSAEPLLVWTADSMERVLPSDLPARAASQPTPIELALARNEAESAQICLRAAPGHALGDLTLDCPQLRGPGGASLAGAQWQQVGYVRLENLRGHPAYPTARAGWWPDALLPVERFSLEPGFTQSLWLTIKAPTNQAPGDYHGQVLVRSGEQVVARIPLRVTIWPLALPERPSLKTAFALMTGFLERVYGTPLPAGLYRRYGDFVLDHRLNPDDISRTEPPDPADLTAWKDRLNAYNVLNMVQPRGQNTWNCFSELDWYTPEHRAETFARLDRAIGSIKPTRALDQAYVYTFDERREEFFPVIRDWFGEVKQRYGVPTLTTAYVPIEPDILSDLNIDWICPLTPRYQRSEADACRAAGHQVWVYTCLGPGFPYANWLADFPLVEARVFGWQAWDQRVDGVLYWGLNIWDRPGNDKPIDTAAGPLLDWSITTGADYDWLHGDGRLIYAGPEGPIGSLRLANLRDGLEDYELLRQASESQAAAAAAVLARVTTGWTQFSRDAAVVRASREQLARLAAKP